MPQKKDSLWILFITKCKPFCFKSCCDSHCIKGSLLVDLLRVTMLSYCLARFCKLIKVCPDWEFAINHLQYHRKNVGDSVGSSVLWVREPIQWWGILGTYLTCGEIKPFSQFALGTKGQFLGAFPGNPALTTNWLRGHTIATDWWRGPQYAKLCVCGGCGEVDDFVRNCSLWNISQQSQLLLVFPASMKPQIK